MEGIVSEPQCDAAAVAREATAMEKLALGTDALQYVDPSPTEVARLTVGLRHASGLRLNNCWRRTEIRGGQWWCLGS